MKTQRNFRYFLKVGSDPQQPVETWDPFYGNTASLTKNRPKEERYYLTKFEGSLTFLRADADKIIAAPFNTEFRVIFELSVNGSYVPWWEGSFYKTDAIEIDEDQRVVSVEAKTVDLINKIIENRSKVYNLIDLSPGVPEYDVFYRKQPLLQVYMAGSDFVTNIISGSYWESPVNKSLLSDFGDVRHNQLVNDYFFSYNGEIIVIPGAGANLNPDVSGLYFTDSAGRIRSFGVPSQFRIRHNSTEGRLEITTDADINPTVLYTAEPSTPIHGSPTHSGQGALFTSVTDPNSQCRVFRAQVYIRYLVDFELVITDQGLTQTNELPVDDIVPDTNYKRAIGITYDGVIASDEHQVDKYKYGRFASNATNFAGEYFLEPAFSRGNIWRVAFPLVRSEWTEVSWWFVFDFDIQTVQINASEVLKIREVFTLDAVIRSFLQEWGLSITFEPDELHSKFLYDSSGNDPVNGDPLPTIVFTAKSNIVLGQYDKPANRVDVKFSDFEEFLKYGYQAYWFIEGNRFRIEHVSWFENGGRYPSEGAAIIRFDLTQRLEPKTGKNWARGTNKYKYDKTLMPERLEFDWMDSVSDTFKGFPIVSKSDYVDKELKEERRISNVTTDIDFISANPTIVNREGLVAMGLFFNSELNGYAVFFGSLDDLPTVEVRWYIQNGQMSFLYLHDKFYRHNAPADVININEADIDASTVRKNKEQTIIVFGETEQNAYGLARSLIGDGELIELQEDVKSGTYRLTIKHDTE